MLQKRPAQTTNKIEAQREKFILNLFFFSFWFTRMQTIAKNLPMRTICMEIEYGGVQAFIDQGSN